MSGSLIYGIDALCEHHVHCQLSSGVRFLDDLLHHLLQSLVSPLDSANLFWRLQSSWIEFFASVRLNTPLLCVPLSTATLSGQPNGRAQPFVNASKHLLELGCP